MNRWRLHLIIMSVAAACATPTSLPATHLPTSAASSANAVTTAAGSPSARTPTLAATATYTPIPTHAPTITATPVSTPTPVPTDTPLPKPAATSAPGDQQAVVDYAPTRASVWEIPAVPDNLVGTCSSAALVVPYGLVALTPGDNRLTLRDQSGSMYALQRLNTNVYVYTGRSALVAGTVSITMTFTSETSLAMQTITILDGDPTCQHVHNHTGVFRWFSR